MSFITNLNATSNILKYSPGRVTPRWSASPRRCRSRRPDVSMVSRSPWRTSTQRCTASSSTPTSRSPARGELVSTGLSGVSTGLSGVPTGCLTVRSLTRREYLFNAIETLPCVKKKADWAINWIGNQAANYGKDTGTSCRGASGGRYRVLIRSLWFLQENAWWPSLPWRASSSLVPSLPSSG